MASKPSLDTSADRMTSAAEEPTDRQPDGQRPPVRSGPALVRDDLGRPYLLGRDGSLSGVPDERTWQLLEATGVPALQDESADAGDSERRQRPGLAVPRAGGARQGCTLTSLDGSSTFFVDGEDGSRRTFWTYGGQIFDVSGISEPQRADTFGPAVPAAAAFPGLADEFTRVVDAPPLSLTTAQQAILAYLQTIPPPVVTAAPGLSITAAPESPPTQYTAPANVAYQVTAQQQAIENVIDSFPVVAPVADAIWPGAVIQSRTLGSGQLGLVQLADRAPGTLTITTEIVVAHPEAPTSVTVTSPSAASVTTARRQLLHDLAGTASTGVVNLEVGTVTTEQQVSARLGVKVSGSSWNASADVHVSGSLETSRTFLKLTQEFYTVAFEPTGSPAWLFGPSVDVAAVKQYSGPNNAPAYIHQVTYGRIVLMVIDSADTASSVEANVKASWKAGVSGDVDTAADLKKKTKSYHVQVATVGTTGATVFKAAAGLSEALEELQATADYSDTNPGGIISYAARYLLDGTVAKAVIGPFSYTALVRADLPQTVSSYKVDDGRTGVQGGVRTGLTLRPGDQVSITAFGHVFAGWWFGSWFGPEGDTSEHGKQMGNATKPLPGVAFSALLYGFGQGWFYWHDKPTFTYGVTTVGQEPNVRTVGPEDAELPLWVHINDDDVTNGKGGFSGQIFVRRRELPAVGPK
ncbi:hypothetical protein GCM10023258_10140 [Terrabacter aeriphilus]|uniref:Minor tail protein n=1 Tax=Terrabacter aeriphilus TaxID=515662 RepID=A0ABP9J6W5_9MICO